MSIWENPEIEILERLFPKGKDVNEKHKTGDIFLHLASRRGKIEAVKFLISEGVEVNAKNNTRSD